MEEPGIPEPRLVEVVGAEAYARSALGGHGATAVRPDQHSDRTGWLRRPGRTHVDSARFEVGDKPSSSVVVADSGHEPDRFAERRHPGAAVRGLAAAADGGPRGGGVVRH